MSLKFPGDKLLGRDVKPDKSKKQAVLEMPSPVNWWEQPSPGEVRIQAVINFLGKFILSIFSKTASLRELLNHKNKFKWTIKHEQEWKLCIPLPMPPGQ